MLQCKTLSRSQIDAAPEEKKEILLVSEKDPPTLIFLRGVDTLLGAFREDLPKRRPRCMGYL